MRRDPLFPVDDPPGDIAAIESLERTLNILSDDQVERPDASARTSSPLAGTAVALRALDDARPPDPSFVAHLEEQLMSTIAVHPRRARTTSPPPARAWSAPGPRAELRRPHRATSRHRGLIEFVSLVALIAVIFGQAMGFGGNLAFWQDPATPSPAPSLATQGDDGTPTDASPQPSAGDGVAVERGNAGRTGEYATAGPTELPALLWRYNHPSGKDMDVLEPIVAGEAAYFSIVRGDAFAVSSLTLPEGMGGFATWLYTGGSRLNVAFGNGLIYAASILSADRDSGIFNPEPALVAYDDMTHVERWRAEIDFASWSSPILAGDTLVVHGNNALFAFDALTGEERWRVPVAVYPGGEIPAARNPAVAGDTVVIEEFEADGRLSGALRAFDLATGTERWTVPSEGGYFGPPAISDDIVYAYEVIAGRLTALDLATGELVWDVPGADERTAGTSTGVNSPVVGEGAVYTFERTGVGSSTMLNARDGRTGDVRWQRDLGDVYARQISLADGVLYFTMDDGAVYAASADDGTELWRIDTGDAGLNTPIPADGYLVIASRTAVYAFGPATDTGTAAGDVSGLPACVSPRSVSDTPPTGEPALSLVGLEDNPLGFGVPTGGRMLLADVPEDEAAGDAAVAGIFATIRAMTACARPGSELDLAGFYSDDYFRRFDQVTRPPGKGAWGYTVVFPVASIAVGDLGAPITLPDERVAILAFDPLGDRGTFLVFVEQDGAWLIDEVVEVGRDPEVWQQG